jgi:hypothetical protein
MATGGLPGELMPRSPWHSIIQWLREDPVLSEWLTDAEQAVLISDRIQELPMWKALTLYLGLNYLYQQMH